jgi:alginate O-acetyltransferase complex protein AlgI
VLHVILRPQPDPWKLVMVAASYLFYGWWDWRFLGLIGASTAFNWLVGEELWKGRRPKGLVLGFGIAANLAMLGFFKYVDFFIESTNSLTGASFPLVNVLLPIGISFFTFQAISYIVDIYRSRINSAYLLDFALYLSFFPQLVAGPIVRPDEFLPQLDGIHRRQGIDTGTAGWLIGRGLLKKVVISNYLAENLVDPVWSAPSAATKIELITASYAYAIQIYADFSGYTDMAIGLALMLGFRFPKNFNNPYRALSVGDFWQRWHMTLSRWLRDYLYVPLGGNRGGRSNTYRNLLLTMVLGGLWHGAAWNFVVWGLMLGTLLVIERVAFSRWGHVTDIATDGFRRVLGHWFLTFHLICISWILFRASTLGEAGEFFNGLLTAPLGSAPPFIAVMVIVGALAIQLVSLDRLGQYKQKFFALEPIIQGGLLAVWIAVVVAAGPDGVSPFIYFQF